MKAYPSYKESGIEWMGMHAFTLEDFATLSVPQL